MAILSAQNEMIKGAVPLNKAVTGEKIIEELLKGGIKININEN